MVAAEYAKALRERVWERLLKATFEEKGFILGELETRVVVSAEGTPKVRFAILGLDT